MKRQINALATFQKAFKSTYNTKPTLLTRDEYLLRYELLKEENKEYLDACLNNDLVEVADAIVDQLFLVIGNAVSHGMGHLLKDMFDEVMSSNMSKLDDNGEPIINGENGVWDESRPKGKLLKSKNFREPNLKQFLE